VVNGIDQFDEGDKTEKIPDRTPGFGGGRARLVLHGSTVVR